MFTKEELVDAVFDIIKTCVDTITLPTGKTLLPSFLLSAFMLIASAISKLLGFLTFVRWQGALIAVILLGGLCFVERHGENEIAKLYSRGKTAAKKVVAAVPKKKPQSNEEEPMGPSAVDLNQLGK